MEGSCYLVQRIVGEGCAEPLLCASVALSEPARSIKEIVKTVLVDNATALLGNVILEGRLRSQFLFPVPPSGALILQDVETAFTVAIPVPGSAPDTRVTVTEAFVSGNVTTVARQSQAGLLLELADRSVLTLAVRVSVQEEVCSPAAPAAAAPHPTRGATRPPKTATICRFTAKGKKPRHD